MDANGKKLTAMDPMDPPVSMSMEDYEGARGEERAWAGFQRPVCVAMVVVVWTVVVVAMMIMVDVVFAVSGDSFPFCEPRRLPSSHLVVGGGRRVYSEEEAVDAFWLVVFLPSSFAFAFSSIYLFAGISVVYAAPGRHSCLKVVENDRCAAKRGSVQCLSTLNFAFMATFALLSIPLGYFTWSLGTSCSAALFWCYEVACWGLVVLLGATAFLLRTKAARIIDAGDHYEFHHERGVELREATAIMPELEQPALTTQKYEPR